MSDNATSEVDEIDGRKRQKFNVTLSSVGETWLSPSFDTSLMRKLYIHNGGGRLKLSIAGGAGPYYELEPEYANDYGKGPSVRLECLALGPDGVATCYIHAEWSR